MKTRSGLLGALVLCALLSISCAMEKRAEEEAVALDVAVVAQGAAFDRPPMLSFESGDSWDGDLGGDEEETDAPADLQDALEEKGYLVTNTIGEGATANVYKASKGGLLYAAKAYKEVKVLRKRAGGRSGGNKHAVDDINNTEAAHNRDITLPESSPVGPGAERFVMGIVDSQSDDPAFSIWPMMSGSLDMFYKDEAVRINDEDSMNRITASACAGLAFLNERNLINHDVKPDNFLLLADSVNKNKIVSAFAADFGCLVDLNPAVKEGLIGYHGNGFCEHAEVCGSAYFFPPEQQWENEKCMEFYNSAANMAKFDSWAAGMSLLISVGPKSLWEDGDRPIRAELCGAERAEILRPENLRPFANGKAIDPKSPWFQTMERLLDCNPTTRFSAAQCAAQMKDFLPSRKDIAAAAEALGYAAVPAMDGEDIADSAAAESVPVSSDPYTVPEAAVASGEASKAPAQSEPAAAGNAPKKKRFGLGNVLQSFLGRKSKE